MKIWSEGDRSSGICEQCRRLVETRFERRAVALDRPVVTVPDVLVAACVECGSIVAIPPQSSPRINAARSGGTLSVKVRISMDQDDVLGLIASQFVSTPNRMFEAALLNYYLEELDCRPEFARRVGHFARAVDRQGRPLKQRTLHLPRPLLDRAASRAAAVGISNRSAMIRALIDAMAEDLDLPDRKLDVVRKVFPGLGPMLSPTKP